jgi:chromate transporter
VPPPSLAAIAREWGRIGVTGFGGPPAHITLLRQLCVEREAWLSADEFEDAIAACNLLPGPASTQLATFCGWRLRGRAGAIVGGLAFILPGLLAIVGLSALFLAGSPPAWVRGAAEGAGSGVAAVAVRAGLGLVPGSVARAPSLLRWGAYAVAGGVAAATLGPWVVVVLLACGLVELVAGNSPLLARVRPVYGGLVWVAFKVGALAYGGGFVIVPLMEGDAVGRHHWLTDTQFTAAVALGQITPGPVLHTVAAVGYGAAGVRGALVAAGVAFAPSFAFVVGGGPRFGALRDNVHAQRFLAGAGPAAVGAIVGSAVPLADALALWWQFVLLGVAAVMVLAFRRSVVLTLVALGVAGALIESL